MDDQKAVDHIIKLLKENLSANLRYHSLQHSLDVMKAAEELAAHFQLPAEDLSLLRTAAAYHDSGFIDTYKNHEVRGCEIAQAHLVKFSYSQKQIERIKAMIMATKVPQSPKNLLEKILCDADLEYLGGQHYDEISGRLFDELGLVGLSISTADWLDMQINFLKSHHYWTPVAQDKLDQRKQKVLSHLLAQKAP